MRQKIFLLFIALAILFLAVLFVLNHHKETIYKAELKNMSPENIIKEYFVALNKHDKKMIKQIIFQSKEIDKFYWYVKSISIIKMDEIENQVQDKNSHNLVYKVRFEVNFGDKGFSSMPDGTYNWTFNLVKSINDNQWYLHDCGY